MKICCVDGCKGPDNKQPVFFEFPTSRLLRKRWLDAINVSSKLCQEAVVCVRHFRRQDYELVRGKTRLKSKVVPRIGSQPKTNDETEISQESTETATSDKIQEYYAEKSIKETTINNGDNHNEDNENVDTEKLTNEDVTEKVNNDVQDNDIINVNNESNVKVCGDDEKFNDIKTAQNNNENSQNDEKEVVNDDEIMNKDNGQIKTYNGEINNDNEKINNDNGKVNNDNGVENNVEKAMQNDRHAEEKTNNDIGSLDNGKVEKRKGNNDTAHNDNGKVRNSRKTRCKITAMRAKIRREDSSDSSSQDSISSSPPLQPEMDAIKEDIEGILTNYYIENKKTERQVAAMTDVIQEDMERREEMERSEERERGGEAGEWFEPTEPVFIELSVGQERNSNPLEGGGGGGGAGGDDCLMVLESVQCEVDPAALLAAAEDMELDPEDIEKVDLDDDDEPDVVKKKEDPISLLTSSDEDDVIIQEPNIDTVEVSSADTSEDDMPLVKLLKASKKSKTNRFTNSKRTKNLITKLLWGGSDFYCVHCRYTTNSSTEYTKHMNTHSKVLQLCQDCGFTTCSKAQMNRHKLKHKNERRFKCHRCNYSAKHKMSLVYHMKTHKNSNEVELAICDTFEPSEASEASRVSKASGKKHNCGLCGYSTNRRSDLKRHRLRIHKSDDFDDDEYVP